MKTCKTVAIAMLLVITSLAAKAQKVSNIDFDEIKAATTDSASIYFYPVLLERFVSQNIPLSDKQCVYLYYGNVFAKGYNPYVYDLEDSKFYEYYNKKEYQKAISFGLEFLGKDPLHVRMLERMAVCYYALGDMVNYRRYLGMGGWLFGAILNSGDGKSKETAYVVTKVSDEYAFMDIMMLSPTKQKFDEDTYMDIITVKKTREVERNAGIDTLYFNISKPFQTLSRDGE